jgi:membrane-bound acyltransferase YfiQ involved in biofilm formation
MIKRLLLLNGLSILGVVFSHAAQWVWVGMFWWADRYRPVTTPNYDHFGTFAYYSVVVLQKLGVFAVPAFLFATGFFIAYADRGKQGLSWQVSWARLKMLLIPYAIWSVVVLLGEYLQGIVYPPLEYVRRLLLGEATPAYFYVLILCQLYLLAPLLAPLAKNASKKLLLGSAALLLMVLGTFYWRLYVTLTGGESFAVDLAASLIPGRFFVRWLFFFALGMVAGFHLEALKRWLARFKWALLGVAVVSFPLAVIETEWIFQQTAMDWRAGIFTLSGSVYVLSSIFVFLAFEEIERWFNRASLSKFLYNLGKASFGIYLLHSSVLEISARAIQKFVPQMLAYPVLLQFVLVTLAVAVPLAIMAVFTKSPARAYYRYLFG